MGRPALEWLRGCGGGRHPGEPGPRPPESSPGLWEARGEGRPGRVGEGRKEENEAGRRGAASGQASEALGKGLSSLSENSGKCVKGRRHML